MITVTGAARILRLLPPLAQPANSSLPSLLLTQMKRAGQQLAEVGPIFNRSYSSRMSVSVTDRSIQSTCVRAVRNS
jgi:hypothetical protein